MCDSCWLVDLSVVGIQLSKIFGDEECVYSFFFFSCHITTIFMFGLGACNINRLLKSVCIDLKTKIVVKMSPNIMVGISH